MRLLAAVLPAASGVPHPGAADFSSAPILRTLADGKQVVFAAQKSGIIYALDPDHGGEVLWQARARREGAARGNRGLSAKARASV